MSDPVLDVLVSAWLDGETSPGESARVEEHLGECRECQANVARYRALGELLARPDPALERVLAAMDHEVEALRRARTRRRWLGAAALLAAAAALLLVVLLPPGEERLEGGASGLARALPGGGAVELAPGARAALLRERPFGAVRLRLESGRVVVTAGPEEELALEAAEGQAELAPGGRATFTRDEEAGRVIVEVETGRVRLEDARGTRELGPGERGALGAPLEGARAPTPSTPEPSGPAEPATPATPEPAAAADPAVELPPERRLDLLRAVRDAGREIDPAARVLRPALPSLLALTTRLDPPALAANLLELWDTAREADRRGVRLLLGDLAADEELPAEARARIVARFTEASGAADPLERRLAARGLGAALPVLGQGALPVLERLEALIRSDPEQGVRIEAVLGIGRWPDPTALRSLELIARDALDPALGELAERLAKETRNKLERKE